jgi:pyruvate carboxylase
MRTRDLRKLADLSILKQDETSSYSREMWSGITTFVISNNLCATRWRNRKNELREPKAATIPRVKIRENP